MLAWFTFWSLKPDTGAAMRLNVYAQRFSGILKYCGNSPTFVSVYYTNGIVLRNYNKFVYIIIIRFFSQSCGCKTEARRATTAIGFR